MSLSKFPLLLFLASINLRAVPNTASCNIYLSPRNCRSCFSSFDILGKDIERIDSLFIVHELGNDGERMHMLYLANKLIAGKCVKDTIYITYQGAIFDEAAKTEYQDPTINELFLKSSPIYFRRDSLNNIEMLAD